MSKDHDPGQNGQLANSVAGNGYARDKQMKRIFVVVLPTGSLHES